MLLPPGGRQKNAHDRRKEKTQSRKKEPKREAGGGGTGPRLVGGIGKIFGTLQRRPKGRRKELTAARNLHEGGGGGKFKGKGACLGKAAKILRS